MLIMNLRLVICLIMCCLMSCVIMSCMSVWLSVCIHILIKRLISKNISIIIGVCIMRVAPCGNCQNTGCGAYHDICPAYLAYKAESQQERLVIYEQKLVNSLCYKEPVKRRKKSAVQR